MILINNTKQKSTKFKGYDESSTFKFSSKKHVLELKLSRLKERFSSCTQWYYFPKYKVWSDINFSSDRIRKIDIEYYYITFGFGFGLKKISKEEFKTKAFRRVNQ